MQDSAVNSCGKKYIYCIMNRIAILFVFLCWNAGLLVAQTTVVDSLRAGIYRARNEKEELNAILKMCGEYQSINRDTLDHYSFKAKAMAAKIGDRHLMDLAAIAVADDYFRWGWLDSALAEITPLVKKYNPAHADERSLYFKTARRQAMYYGSKMKYPEALAILYKLLSEAEQYNDSLTLGSNINTIGSIALVRESPHVAKPWFYRALGYLKQGPGADAIRAPLFINLSEAHFLSGNLDSAVYYSEHGIKLYRQQQILMGLATALQRQSKIYLRAGNLQQAEAALKEMIEVRQATHDGDMYIDDNISLVDFYLLTNQQNKAIDYCNKMLVRGNLYEAEPGEGRTLTNVLSLRLMYYELLSKAYKQKGDKENYQLILEDIILAKDSLAAAKSEEAIAEMQTKYEVQKKVNTIIQQELTIAQKNNTFYIALGTAILLLVIAFFLFRDYRKKQRQKVKQAVDNEKQLSVKAVADAEENERKRIAADLHDNLGAYAASIASNLEVLQSDQLTQHHATALEELNNNSQTMVAQLSDTIWALNKDSLTLTAIIDRIKVFINRIGKSHPNIVMEVTEDIDEDVQLPPTQAFHLFQIIQEAITNAVKHSGANRIMVKLKGGHHWTIIVTDNGKGISASGGTYSAGNGLRNMKERAAVSGWEIQWLPGDPNGTVVLIKLVIHNH